MVRDYIKSSSHDLSHVYYPYDVKFICRKFLNKLNPQVAIYFETELWPRMYGLLNKRGVKLYLFNARISEKSLIGYLKIKSFISKTLNQINFIAAQSKEDEARLKNTGL